MTAQKSEKSQVPIDAQIIEEMLRSMGITSWEPRVVNQIMELMHRYTSEVLREAQVYSEYSSKSVVDVDDVRIAVRAVCANSFTTPPTREVLAHLAQVRNAVPLRAISGRVGLRLPPEEFTLTQPGWQVRLPTKRKASEQTPEVDQPKSNTVIKKPCLTDNKPTEMSVDTDGSNKVSFSLKPINPK
mmetsp:Transcript_39731/g.55164  ORF Transcript_39731/g.55164 Transcript_39731/m.55164 type:complete len:186 (-) Transcript_39731:8-565(-)|eukprot:CAMPEP_0196585384 /NCGR_PEP_ID=MMETSP1081-20130531/50449_1 /TAXON_ID=36882 /ORGANISM="Pyramimonas amylifera, Strain CCMP720" /LENGTH=185 /DNA_ID=CAMNT_0041906907 /DNA_START=310 /DNA_END=867 /DNA_ORIENTATION=+